MNVRWLLVLSSLVACTEVDDSISTLVDRYLAILAGESATLCRCAKSLGYDSTQECMSDPLLGPIDDDDRACMIDAFDHDELAARNYFECMIPAEEELARCIAAQPDCPDMLLAFEVCLDPYVDEVLACELPQSVAAAFDSCWSWSARDDEVVERASSMLN